MHSRIAWKTSIRSFFCLLNCFILFGFIPGKFSFSCSYVLQFLLRVFFPVISSVWWRNLSNTPSVLKSFINIASDSLSFVELFTSIFCNHLFVLWNCANILFQKVDISFDSPAASLTNVDFLCYVILNNDVTQKGNIWQMPNQFEDIYFKKRPNNWKPHQLSWWNWPLTQNSL